MTTCCFTGHRVIAPEVRDQLTAILDRRLQALYDVGFVEFRAGGALGFDTLAAERVLLLRERHPDCRLVLMLPCRDQSKYWSEAEAGGRKSIPYSAFEEKYEVSFEKNSIINYLEALNTYLISKN